MKRLILFVCVALALFLIGTWIPVRGQLPPPGLTPLAPPIQPGYGPIATMRPLSSPVPLQPPVQPGYGPIITTTPIPIWTAIPTWTPFPPGPTWTPQGWMKVYFTYEAMTYTCPSTACWVTPIYRFKLNETATVRWAGPGWYQVEDGWAWGLYVEDWTCRRSPY